jgi:hypothetical protein
MNTLPARDRHGNSTLQVRLLNLSALAGLALLLVACATPVGVTRIGPQELNRTLASNVLSSGNLSANSMQVLQRNNLVALYEDDPEAALAALHGGLPQKMNPSRLLGLAELSFLHAQSSGKREHYLAAAAYAYAYLFPEDGSPPPNSLDPGLRLAADLYNRGLTAGLAAPEGDHVVIQEGRYALPFGQLELTLDSAQFEWSGYRFSRFVPVAEFKVRGLRNRYRQAGVGVPLAAEVTPIEVGQDVETARRRIPPRIKVPVTAFVRFEGPLVELGLDFERVYFVDAVQKTRLAFSIGP